MSIKHFHYVNVLSSCHRYDPGLGKVHLQQNVSFFSGFHHAIEQRKINAISIFSGKIFSVYHTGTVHCVWNLDEKSIQSPHHPFFCVIKIIVHTYSKCPAVCIIVDWIDVSGLHHYRPAKYERQKHESPRNPNQTHETTNWNNNWGSYRKNSLLIFDRVKEKREVGNEAAQWRFQSPYFTRRHISRDSRELGVWLPRQRSSLADSQAAAKAGSDLPPGWHALAGNCGHLRSHKKGNHRRPQTRQTFSFA